MHGSGFLPGSQRATIASLLWLLCYKSLLALASEVCMIPFGTDYLIIYVKCPDYCCKYKNASQYCCSDCNLSVNADSCTPEQLWRYILYIGLGIAGTVILCYLVVYLVKNCKEPMKRACCKQRTTRVQDPNISMTTASAWPGPARRVRSPPWLPPDTEEIGDTCDSFSSAYPRPPPPPAYSNPEAAVQRQRDRDSGAATPPPIYSEGAARPDAAAAEGVHEPPPAYSEPTSLSQQR